ncbi:helix-turn-helix domain-containing protein [Methylobacterium tarhaniae]|uniref:helix-turn-helix domain-containing protein n=1 Tax=Methylobacterium tarhaniae TaxID=1187852 RepID=UPI00069D0924|nr:helix-turn-helix domain-containing protein [Methylobacterium tarhaniae]
MPETVAVIPSPAADREPNARLAQEIRRFRSEGAREAGALTLLGPSGETFGTLTESAVLALEAALTQLAETDEVMLGSRDTELSPEAAARVLGVSRPVVYHRMKTGRLPYREAGSHRRVLYKDVLALRRFEEERCATSKALSEDADGQEEPAPRAS